MYVHHDVLVGDPDAFSIVIVEPGAGVEIYVMTPDDSCYEEISDLITGGVKHALIAYTVRGYLQPIITYHDTPVVLFPE